MIKEIYALGVGHNTPVMIDLAESCGFEIKGLYHYNKGRTGEYDHGFKILGSFEDLFNEISLKGKCFLLTMGDNLIRADLARKIMDKEGQLPTLIHPSAVVSRFSNISSIGVCILPFTCVEAGSSIGDNSILLSHVDISHNTNVGKNCFIASGTIVGAYTNVEDFVFLGLGSLSISGKVHKIGTHAYIGARTLITKNVPEYTLFYGNPGKVISNIKR